MMKKCRWKSLLAVLLAVSFCGCAGDVQQTTGDAEVELIEPVVEALNGEKAEYRNLYNYKTYAASVYPEVKEYAYSQTTYLEDYLAYYGESVKENQALAYGNTEALDEEILELEEAIALMDEELREAEVQLEEELAPMRNELGTYKWAYEAYLNAEPAEKIPSSDPNSEEMVANPEYATWQNELNRWEGQYRITAHEIYMKEEALRQRKELYVLERKYLSAVLGDMQAQRKENFLVAKEDGVVVAMGDRYSAEAEIPIVAVGDMGHKLLKTDYINKADIAKAVDYYALINGERYEVEYVPMDNNEYTKLTEAGEKPYTTFEFVGDSGDVKVGGYGVIVLFTEKKENVLSVPKAALHQDETGYYVYVKRGSEGVYTSVKIGSTGGAYTEILSGLSEGDFVLSDDTLDYSGETTTVSYGSYSTTFENSGRMYYSERVEVTNPVEYGTTYFGEFLVAPYQHVDKGDVIATIRVKKDEITIERNRVALQRLQERLNDLIAENNEYNAELIAVRKEEIAELSAFIDEMETAATITEIRATRSGVITRMEYYDAEDIISYEAFIVEISDDTSCYLEIENINQLLNYGNNVDISYTGNDGQNKSSTGVVVSVSAAGVSGALQSEWAYILLPEESVSDMALTNLNRDSYWNSYRYRVTATVREMNDILVVPRNAVREIEGHPYVYVMDEQGDVKAIGFVAAGYNASEYWVVEGLTEGMVLCLK